MAEIIYPEQFKRQLPKINKPDTYSEYSLEQKLRALKYLRIMLNVLEKRIPVKDRKPKLTLL